MKFRLFILLLLTIKCLIAHTQTQNRPLIWVKPSDKLEILNKIKTQKWANEYYQKFKARVDEDVKNHAASPKQYLSKMPLNWSVNNDEMPKMIQFKSNGGIEADKRQALIHYLQTAIDCGIIYYLTDEEPYAQLALDVVYTVVEAIAPLKPSDNGHNGGGYLYLDDHLREAREIGAQLPVAYDFVFNFIHKGGKPFNISSNKKANFSIRNAEIVFKTYIKLALEQGIVDCNWPVLESSSLVCNTLALSDLKERNEFLEYYLTKNTPHQDALLKVANFYTKNGGIWPESLGYSNDVSRLSTYLMTLLTRYDSNLDLGNKYPQIPMALSMSHYLTYPNKKETILFGDGHRGYHPDFDSYEMAYNLGKISKNYTLIDEFGALLRNNILNNTYDRSELQKRSYGASVYREPTHLLWDLPEIEGKIKDYPLPITDILPFAGITLQRNLSPTNNEKDDLMAFVGGSAFVHGHATGMSMELYGKGYVLGTKAGRGTYQTDIHENYFRLFASNNTVVVNGASETSGGWVSLGQNTVEIIAAEPKPREKPVSPNHSFSVSRFIDDKGDNAEAIQERTLGIVRTSQTTGYYVDVFRSKSNLPHQFHDYIYRNLGESLELESDGKKLEFNSDENRFKASASKEWIINIKFRHPGWHFFKEVRTAINPTQTSTISATYTANKLEATPIKMRLFINNPAERQYTTALSPLSEEVPRPYAGKDAQTLIVRQNGEAWNKPFVVIFEPFEGDKGSIQSVENIVENGEFKGLKIKSLINKKIQTDIVLNLDNPESSYENKEFNILFKGRYCVISFDNKNELISSYIGEGGILKINNKEINSIKAFNSASYWEKK